MLVINIQADYLRFIIWCPFNITTSSWTASWVGTEGVFVRGWSQTRWQSSGLGEDDKFTVLTKLQPASLLKFFFNLFTPNLSTVKPRSLSTSFNLQSCWLLALCLRRWLFKTTSGVDKIAGKPPDFEINIILTFLWIEWGWQTCGLHCRVKTEFNQVFTSAARKFVNFALVGKLACLLSMYFLDKTTTKYNLFTFIYADFESRW